MKVNNGFENAIFHQNQNLKILWAGRYKKHIILRIFNAIIRFHILKNCTVPNCDHVHYGKISHSCRIVLLVNNAHTSLFNNEDKIPLVHSFNRNPL